MKSPLLPALALLAVSSFAWGAETIYTPPPPLPAGANPCATPAPRDAWLSTVQDKFTRFSGKPLPILFDGDSITAGWEGAGRAVWEKTYAKNSADFGIGGDRVENILWRLSKGQVDGMDPKVIVILIGTNNVPTTNTADQIAEGIQAVIAEYEKRCPHAHIILMKIFPRSEKPTDPFRLKAEAVNAKIAGFASDTVSFVDISSKLTEPDGTISPKMMPDFLHPGVTGYQIWSDAIQPIIQKYVGTANP